jgi:hypothetical protein
MSSWLERHNRFTRLLGAVALAIALAGFALTIWLNAEQNSRFDAEKTAKRAAAQKIDPIICHLVYAYVHPVPGTNQNDRADQLDSAWREVGLIVGCPDGIAPKGN